MLISDLFKNIPHRIIQGNENSLDIKQIEIDSRKVEPDTLFICITGLTTNGHDYISSAVTNGATAILVEKEDLQLPKEITVIHVENTREVMSYVAANFYDNPANKLRLIGVTGTNGKTTVTCFIEEILRNCGRKTGLIGTTGAKIGTENLDISFATSTTPDPLELHKIFAHMLKAGVQDVVIEVTSHALVLHKTKGLTFHVGVFTNLTQDHLDIHGTMENYRLAKAELFAQSKHGVVNIDDESTPTMISKLGSNPFTTYAIENKTNLRAIHINHCPEFSEFKVNDMNYKLVPRGKFNIYNALAAISTAEVLGLDRNKIREAVSQIKGVPGRIQSVVNNYGYNVYVDYAHTPDGLQNIITAVREFTKGRVITIFGCGGDRDKDKRPIMGKVAGKLSDYCIITSDYPRTENPMDIINQVEEGIKQTNTDYLVIENRFNAIIQGVRLLSYGDSLIIAGKGHEDYQIIGTTKHDFDDYKVAEKAISDRGEVIS